MKRSPVLSLFIFLSALLFSTSYAAVVDVSWSRSISDNWSDSQNWQPAITPNNGTDTYNVDISNAGVRVDGSYTIDSLSLDSAGLLMMSYGNSLTLSADSTNSGTIKLADNHSYSANQAALKINGNVEINGTITDPGRIVFGTMHQNNIRYTNASDILTLGQYQTITTNSSSIGTIHTDMINNGIINADRGNITLNSINLTNNGSVKASNAGTMYIQSSAINNTSGTITSQAASRVNLNNSTVTGGTINGPGVVNIDGTVTFDASAGMRIDNAQVRLGHDDTLKVKGSLTNNTTIELNDTHSYTSNEAAFKIDGDVTVDGTGVIRFDSMYQNNIKYTNAADKLTLGSGQTITTRNGANGTINANVVNNGIIEANNGTVTLTTRNKQNNNKIQSLNGGTININSINVDNNHTIEVDAASTLNLNNAAITGGQIAGTGKVNINGTVNLDTEDTMQINHSDVLAGYNDNLKVHGDLVNNTTIRLKDTHSYTSNQAALTIVGDVALNGTGGIRFESNYQNNIKYTNAADKLTLGNSQTISTASWSNGSIAVDLVNNGNVEANNGTITLHNRDKQNNKTIQAVNSGTINVNSINIDNNNEINIDSTSTLALNNATITGGYINGTGKIEIVGTSTLDGTVNSVRLGQLDTRIDYNETLKLKGDISNNASISLRDIHSYTSNAAMLKIDGDVELTGDGQVSFDSIHQNKITYTNITDTLTIGPDQKVLISNASHKGMIQTQIDNRGLMSFAGSMTIGNGSAENFNSGQLNIVSAITKINGSNFTNTSAGIIKGGGTLDVSTINFENEGTLAAGNSIGTLDIIGDYNQTTGTLQVEIDALDSYDLIQVNGSAYMSGYIDVILGGGYIPNEGDIFSVLTTTGTITDLGVSFAAGDMGAWNLDIVNSNTVQLEYVPEPCSLFLLGIGGFILRRKSS